VTKGDLTRSITVEAQGEVAALKDNINEMILNLKDTTQKNTETDWLKTNLAKFTRMLQGQRDMKQVAQMVLSELAPLVDAQQGVFYVNQSDNGDATMNLLGGYAYNKRKNLANEFHAGEGLVGQCMLEKERILVTNVPSNYVQIKSGLGEAAPNNGVYASGRTGFYEHNLYPLRYNKAVADITRQTTGENIIWARSTWAAGIPARS